MFPETEDYHFSNKNWALSSEGAALTHVRDTAGCLNHGHLCRQTETSPYSPKCMLQAIVIIST